ncbi:Alkane hydroxylase MAH1 [Bienertia sinuspersici]
MEYVEILLVFISFVLLFYYFRNKNGLPTNWPLVGMLLPLLTNVHRIHDWLVEIQQKSQQNFLFKGPWFTNMVLLITCDPSNIHHIMSKNFQNYPKGTKFNEIFDVLGDGIFNVDFDLWKYHRSTAHTFLGHPRFRRFLLEKVEEKVEKALIPILDHASNNGLVVNLQDLFERFTFDTICTLIMGHDFGSLCVELPHVPFSKALDDVEEVILYRHVVPMSVWKFIRWLGIGKERKYKDAWIILDDFIYKCIDKKRKELKPQEIDQYEGVGLDLLTLYMNENVSDKFLRDTILNYFIAGRDTTSSALSWFFYLLTKNPQVVSKIRED